MITSSILSVGVSALAKSLRISWEGDPLPERSVVAFWHSRMIAGWWLSREGAVAIVSKSKDGEYLSSILSRWNYKLVRGSSGKGGMEALEEAIAVVRRGEAHRLVITPDGPQGPPEIFKRGAFIAARELGLPLHFLEIKYKSKKILTSSWDKFEVPLPFTSVSIKTLLVDTSGFPSEHNAQVMYLQTISEQYASY